jgi:hypothetical protein
VRQVAKLVDIWLKEVMVQLAARCYVNLGSNLTSQTNQEKNNRSSLQVHTPLTGELQC